MDPKIKAVAEEAAQKTIRETFKLLGVDTECVESVNEFRADLIFARELRRTKETAAARIFYVVIGVVTLACLAAVAKGFGFGMKD